MVIVLVILVIGVPIAVIAVAKHADAAERRIIAAIHADKENRP